jgi:hypothetical protein
MMAGWMISESEPIHQRTMKEGWMISEQELNPPAHHDGGMMSEPEHFHQRTIG